MEPAAASAPKGAHGGRIDDIEVLRAFAVGLVLIQHLPGNLLLFMLADHGAIYGHLGFWSGVDLFFAISGFVIARSLLPTLGAAATPRDFFAATLAFWTRRIWRLLPTAWLWLAIMLLLAVGFNRTGVFGSVQANLAEAGAALVYLANFWMLHAMSTGHLGVAAIYWTLSIEEQFYIALPILAFLFRKRLALVVALVALAQLFLDRSSPHGSLLLNLTRSDALGLGVLLAVWSMRQSYAQAEPVWLAGSHWRWLIAPLFLAVFCVVSGPLVRPWPREMALVTLLGVAIVWLASYDRGYVLPEGRLKAALCWIGARSYALYLIHLPVYHAATEFWCRVHPQMLRASWAHVAVLLLSALPLSFLLAELNYRFVETPLRRRGARIAERVRRGRRDALGARPFQTAA